MAGSHKPGQGDLHASEVCQFLTYIRELVLGQMARFRTVGAILKPEQFGNFIQTEAESLRGFYEAYARNVH